LTLVRGIMLGLVTCLALTGAPAQAAAPAAAAPQAEQQAAGKDWQVLQSWKGGVMRACRGKWDGDSFHLSIQLVNRAERGRRGAVLSARTADVDEWSKEEYAPIAAGSKQMLVRQDVFQRPRIFKVRAKITKGEKKSAWGKVVRLDRLDIC